MKTKNTIGTCTGFGLGIAVLLGAAPAPACPPDEAACASTTQTVTLRAVDGNRAVVLDGTTGLVLDATANVVLDGTGNIVLAGADDVHANVWVSGVAGGDDDNPLAGAEATTMEISLADGKVTVRIDGKEVPADRIRHEKGRIVILDAEGKEIETIHIGMPSHGVFDATGNMPFGVGGALPGQDSMFEVAKVEEPKVMLGILLDEPGPALRHHFDLAPGTTTMISALYKGLPAHAAGLDQYDIIVEIEGEEPADPGSLRAALANREPGDEIEITVVHHGRTKRVEIALEAFDREAMAKAEMIGEAPQATMQFDRFFQDGQPGLDFTTEMPDLGELRFGPGEGRQRVFVTPRQEVFELAPAAPRLPRPRGQSDGTGEDVLDDRLQQLDRRLAELEEMLDALLQRAKAKKGGTR